MAGSAADPAFDPDDAPFSIVTGPTRDVLNDLTPKALPDYRQLKIDMLRWLDARGKNPHRRRGLSENTLEQVSMKLDQTYRWYWEEAGYFGLDFGPEDATKLMEEYSLYDYTDATLLSFKKNIKRYFRYCNWERGTDYDWECPVQLSEKQRTNRDYFRRDEFAPLYHAAMDHGSVKHPNQMSPEERDRARAYLAQRFEKPKTEIGPDDFDRANSYKIASLIGVTLDTGLRPVEVGRAKTSWVNPTDGTLDIPSSEATKSDNNWKCALSARAQRAMSNMAR